MLRAVNDYELQAPLLKDDKARNKLANKIKVAKRSLKRRVGLEPGTPVTVLREGDHAKGQFSLALTPVVEDLMVEWCLERQHMNVPVTRWEFAEEVNRVTNGVVQCSNNFFYAFVERHPDLDILTSQSYSDRRTNSKTVSAGKQHFSTQLKAIERCARLSGYESISEMKAHQFGNLDEKGVQPKRGTFRCLGAKGVDAHATDPQNISITGVEHVYGNGHVGRRILIMQGSSVPSHVNIARMDSNAVLTANAKGGMDRKIWAELVIPAVIDAKNEICTAEE